MMNKLLLSFLIGGLLLGSLPAANGQDAKPAQGKPDRAAAYYHYSLGHLYAELAGAYGNKGDFLDKAIDNYRLAMEADPAANFLSEELSDLYIQAGRLREAVLDSEAALRADPDDLNARRILARIYTRLIGDSKQQSVSEEMVKKAIEQYEKISERTPDDKQVWLLLGRLYKVSQDSVASESAYNKVLALDADNEDALVGLAMVYSDLGDHPRASAMLQRVTGKNPNVRTLTFLAGTYEEMGEHALAAETYRKALEFSPDNSEIKRALAQNLLYNHKEEEARVVYEDLAEENPRDYISQLRLSQIYRDARDFPKAWDALKAAKDAAPDNLEILYHEVNLYDMQGQTEQALEALRHILSSTEKASYSAGEIANRAIFLERLGLMYRSIDHYEDAVATFQQLASLNPELASRVSAQISDTYRQAKDFQKAVEVIEEASKKYPEDPMVVLIKATVLADVGRNEEAIAVVEKLVAGKEDRESLLTLAQIYEKTKAFDKMAKVISQAVDLSKSEEERASVLFMQGAMYERQKQFEKAETSFRAVLKLSPDNASAMNYLGYMFADQNVKLDEARQLVSKALELEPENGAFLDSMGWVQYRRQQFDEAETYLLRAVRKVSKDPVVHDHLGDVYFKQDKLREAIAQWRIALQEWQTSSETEKDLIEVSKIQKKLEGAEVRLAREPSSSASKP